MNFFLNLLLAIPATLIALTFNGFGQALGAYLLGDNTPKYTGRLSISPSVHIEPIGFILFLVAHFGWSKPVPVNPNNFKNKRYGMALFMISGAIANLLVAFIFLIVLKILVTARVDFVGLYEVIKYIISLNIIFVVWQFIPIPPFSGYYFIREFLPYKLRLKIAPIERYSMLIFLFMIMTGILQPFVSFIYTFIITVLAKIAGI